MKIKIRDAAVTFLLAFAFTNQASLAVESDIFTSPPSPGYAKIRIWNSDLSNGIAGHVSLQTQGNIENQAGVYLSLWPNADGDDVTHTGAVTPKLNAIGEFVFDAPAIGMTNYLQDFENEDNKHPDHVYLIKLDTDIINQIAMLLLKNGAYRYSDTDEKFILNENYRWYAPGRSDVRPQGLDHNKTYLNCATSVLFALCLGNGISGSHIESALTLNDLGSQTLKILAEHQTEAEELNILSDFLKIITPGNIEAILNLKTKESFKKALNIEINSGRITGIQKNDDLTINQILEYLQPYLKDETRSITDIFREIGWLSPFSILKLPQDLQEKIAYAKKVETVVVGTVAAAGVGVLIYGIVTTAPKNNCVII